MFRWLSKLSAPALALAAVVGLAAPPIGAQQHLNKARGFNANGAYQLGDLDSVNLFNGNLTVTIPIGPRFPLNDGFGYNLQLVYNSNLWNFREVCTNVANASYEGFYSPWFIDINNEDENVSIYGHWDLIPPDALGDGDFFGPRVGGGDNPCSTLAYPNPTANAGHGWQLTLGRLFPPRANDLGETNPNKNESGLWLYVSPDGSDHLFFSALHVEEGGGPTAPPVPTPRVSYTRDGSYLRMRVVDDEDHLRAIDFPNGDTQFFSWFGGEDWRLTSYTSALSGHLSIQYHDNLPHPEWHITDSAGRFHKVVFDTPNANQAPRILEVQLANATSNPAVYAFSYSTSTINRACPSHLSAGLPEVEVSLLQSLTLPDGQKFRMLNYDLTGLNTSCEISGVMTRLQTPTGSQVEWDFHAPDPDWFDQDRGWLNGYTYPQGSSPRAYVRGTTGVRERRVFDPVRNQTDVWTYDPHLQCTQPPGTPLAECFDFGVGPDNRPPVDQPEEFVNVVTSPDGSKTVNFFSVFAIGARDVADPETWRAREYGLPFSKRAYEEVPGRGRVYLSQEHFPAGVEPFPLPTTPGVPAARPTPLRAHYVRYETDTPGYNETGPEHIYAAFNSGFGEHLLLNRREVGSRTVYFNQTGGREGHRDTWRESFDGLGHYRTTVLSGDIAAVGNVGKTVTTRYNPNGGTYPGGFNPIPSTAPWLTSLYDETTASQPGGGLTHKTKYCFDESTGFLEGTRVIAGSNENGRDLLTLYERTTENLENQDERVILRERRWGGDGSGQNGMPASCASAVTSGAEYRIDRAYRYGVLEHEAWVDDNNNQVVLVTEDHTWSGSQNPGIDRNTGLYLVSRDADGLETHQQYDAMGRIVRVSPQGPGLALTRIEYQLLGTPDNPAGARIDTCQLPAGSAATCSSGSAITQAYMEVDGSGAPVESRNRYPADTSTCSTGWAKQRHWFGFTGTSVRRQEHLGSSQCSNEGEGQTKWTKKIYDQFGRLEEIREPRFATFGEIGKTFFEFGGDWTQREANWQFLHSPGATNGGALTGLSRWTVNDLSGRLVKVTEQNLETPGGAGITRYEYDAGDNLTEVRFHEPDAQGEAGTLLQSRSFQYDGRGFLTAEQHPELGANGNGWVFYTYDSVGNVLTKRHDAAGGSGQFFDLDYAYDKAGRLIEVRGVPLPGETPTLLEQRFYARGNYAPFGDRSAGKLVQAKRFNPEAGLRVTETFRYDNADAGQLSERVVRVNDPRGAFSFQQSFAYGPLGELVAQDYPELSCLGGHCPQIGAPDRTVTQTYQDNHLTKVATAINGASLDVAAEIDYHPNGMVREVVHRTRNAQGAFVDTRELITNDPDGLPRPWNIQHIAAGGAAWDEGPFTYDGAGNLYEAGATHPDRFAYDGAGRLQWAAVQVDKCATPPCPTFEAEYDYDVPGNITGFRLRKNGLAVERVVDGVSTQTNRLTGAGNGYDKAGNLVVWRNILSASYDPFNRLAALGGQGVSKHMAYNASGERLITFDYQLDPQGVEIWRLRGLNNEVLRELKRTPSGSWTWTRDTLYRGKLPLAYVTPAAGGGETLTHLYLDHLGTPRHTSTGSFLADYREYLPFGEEATPRHEGDPLQFTGHERDSNCSVLACVGVPGEGDDLDYMHARHFSPWQMRFLSVDPVGGKPGLPQSWNRYAYAHNSPVTGVDPDGRIVFKVIKTAVKVAIKGGDLYGAVKGAVEDVQTIFDPHTSGAEKLLAGVSLATEIFSPVSLKEAKAGAKALGVLDDAADTKKAINRADNLTDRAKLQRIHSNSTLTSPENRANLESVRQMKTEDIVESLKPGKPDSLKVKPDGRVMDGNTRLYVLEERGYDLESLPREELPAPRNDFDFF